MEDSVKATNEYSGVSVLAAIFSVTMLYLFVGYFETAKALYQVFEDINKYGTGDVKETATKISNCFVPLVYYLICSLPGWALAMGILLFSRFRSKVYYRFLAAMSFFFVIGFPFTTLFGVILGITLFIKRKEFQ